MIRTKVSGDFELVIYSLQKQHWANDIMKLSWSIRTILQSPSCGVLSLKAYSFDHVDVVSSLILCLVLTVFFSYIYSMYLHNPMKFIFCQKRHGIFQENDNTDRKSWYVLVKGNKQPKVKSLQWYTDGLIYNSYKMILSDCPYIIMSTRPQ